ncbi:hypothetical protein, partial [Salmonella sp. SAL4457]|uniref:hypothetical protein n=1 Tax=Salmonella sp. SAL4457 TaxID=3159912 RepID=UPI00397AA97E
GKVEDAMRFLLPAENRPPKGASLREDLEVRFNSAAQPGAKGPFSEFLQSEVVRFIVQAGQQTDVKFLSVSDWDYAQ